ncbi:sugar ABC transporter ATP-binding protein [Mesorhizobium sp. M3A.F.Ca.ET.201.01.1.1]|uniref:sugar ABC transporter ATP-binding protein n=1 Tax=Mesorhizobium sp. M3A.F.Ca.ET.201.01.1.1 TaxID=2563946 RepID=UPI001FF038D5|nr:sugar ABC transporter ATP-binding protein [Mesorhizobium sp. M3A.F.Ca.ET.201.01.1.1]
MKRFGETVALNDCSLTINPGEVHAIVGENGSGKSTLAKIIAGVLQPDSGRVSIFGDSPRDPMHARALGVAMIFQEVLVAETLSVVDNIFAGTDSLWKRSRTRKEAREQSRAILKRFTGLDIDPSTLVQQLPLSVKQWIVIARALLSKPRLLIFDESSAALDLDATTRLHAEIEKARDAGCCIVIVTHRIAELVRIANRATVLRDGRVVDELVGSSITEANLLRLMSAKNVVVEAKRTSSTPAVMREARDVVLSARGLCLDHDVPPFDFNLRAGEIVGVVGLDGQGQSDFIRAAAGLRSPHSGSISVVGRKGPGLVPLDAKSPGVAYVSGDRAHEGIFPNLSIFENFALPLYKPSFGEYGLIKRRPMEAAFQREVKRLSIKTGRASNLITSLSGGNQQKVLIGRAFATDPKIIVLDDPARGVDFATKQELYAQLKMFVEQGGAVIYLSSEIEDFFDFADRVLVFRANAPFRTIPAVRFSEHAFLAAMFGEPEEASMSFEPAGAA